MSDLEHVQALLFMPVSHTPFSPNLPRFLPAPRPVLQNARGTALFASTAEAPRGSASSAEDRRSYPRLLRRVEAGGAPW